MNNICPNCGKKLYVVRTKKDGKIVEAMYCSFCFSQFDKEENVENETRSL